MTRKEIKILEYAVAEETKEKAKEILDKLSYNLPAMVEMPRLVFSNSNHSENLSTLERHRNRPSTIRIYVKNFVKLWPEDSGKYRDFFLAATIAHELMHIVLAFYSEDPSFTPKSLYNMIAAVDQKIELKRPGANNGTHESPCERYCDYMGFRCACDMIKNEELSESCREKINTLLHQAEEAYYLEAYRDTDGKIKPLFSTFIKNAMIFKDKIPGLFLIFDDNCESLISAEGIVKWLKKQPEDIFYRQLLLQYFMFSNGNYEKVYNGNASDETDEDSWTKLLVKNPDIKSILEEETKKYITAATERINDQSIASMFASPESMGFNSFELVKHCGILQEKAKKYGLAIHGETLQ